MINILTILLGATLQCATSAPDLPKSVLTPHYLVTYEQVVEWSHSPACEQAGSRYETSRARLAESSAWVALQQSDDYLAQQQIESRWAAECTLVNPPPLACDALSVDRLIRRARLLRANDYVAFYSSPEAQEARQAQESFNSARCYVGALPLQETALHVNPILSDLPSTMDATSGWSEKVAQLVNSAAYKQVRNVAQYARVQEVARKIVADCPQLNSPQACRALYEELQTEGDSLAKTSVWQALALPVAH